MKHLQGIIIGLSVGLSQGAFAQAADTLLRNQDVTVDALVDALSPGITTRSIRVRPGPGPAAAPPASSVAQRPSDRPKASLLITFETNSTELTAQAMQTLDVVGKALKSDELTDFNFAIEGHADPRGGSDLNRRLSQGRAESVRRYLVQAHGISESRLNAIGKGDRELMNRANLAAPENRRVTIVNMSN